MAMTVGPERVFRLSSSRFRLAPWVRPNKPWRPAPPARPRPAAASTWPRALCWAADWEAACWAARSFWAPGSPPQVRGSYHSARLARAARAAAACTSSSSRGAGTVHLHDAGRQVAGRAAVLVVELDPLHVVLRGLLPEPLDVHDLVVAVGPAVQDVQELLVLLGLLDVKELRVGLGDLDDVLVVLGLGEKR